jgi:hypothetical protein
LFSVCVVDNRAERDNWVTAISSAIEVAHTTKPSITPLASTTTNGDEKKTDGSAAAAGAKKDDLFHEVDVQLEEFFALEKEFKAALNNVSAYRIFFFFFLLPIAFCWFG